MQRYEIIFKVEKQTADFFGGIKVWNMKNSEAERLELMHSLREEGKTLQEIADIVGSSTSTVHRLIQKKS